MKIEVPEGHQIGMVVPRGGSNCAKCVHVSDDEKRCDEQYFVKWNGGHVLPAEAEVYCCDFFSAKTKKATMGDALHKRRERK